MGRLQPEAEGAFGSFVTCHSLQNHHTTTTQGLNVVLIADIDDATTVGHYSQYLTALDRQLQNPLYPVNRRKSPALLEGCAVVDVGDALVSEGSLVVRARLYLEALH